MTRHYTEEFKLRAVKLCLESGKSDAEISKEFERRLNFWKRLRDDAVYQIGARSLLVWNLVFQDFDAFYQIFYSNFDLILKDDEIERFRFYLYR